MDLARCENRITLIVSESDLDVLAVAVGANEVTSVNSHVSIFLGLDWAERGLKFNHMRRRVIREALDDGGARAFDVCPVNAVPADLHEGERVFWLGDRRIDSLIITELVCCQFVLMDKSLGSGVDEADPKSVLSLRVVSICLLLRREGLETNAIDLYSGTTGRGTLLRTMEVHKRFLVVLIGCEWVLQVHNTLISILLPVVRDLHDNSAGVAGLGRSYLQLVRVKFLRFNLHGREAHFNITKVRLLQASHIYSDRGLSLQHSAKGSNSYHLRLLVIVEPHAACHDLDTAIHSQLELIEVPSGSIGTNQAVTLLVKQRRRITIQQALVENCSVCEHCLVEDTHGFVGAQVQEILTCHFNLGVAEVWPAYWGN